eukprot:TRINITY_DN21684_c0_g1_i4.p1 TRINITY_DN21684_c0_g1~~TRINITY_DN21684_c0_g1_i4.p1  ORF type:complete len:173 (+),score=45.99 TRINITY_DN21684_c0_g1_i4:138-656(+)
MIRRPPRSTLSSSSAASDVYKRQVSTQSTGGINAEYGGSCIRMSRIPRPSGLRQPTALRQPTQVASSKLSGPARRVPDSSSDARAPSERNASDKNASSAKPETATPKKRPAAKRYDPNEHARKKKEAMEKAKAIKAARMAAQKNATIEEEAAVEEETTCQPRPEIRLSLIHI